MARSRPTSPPRGHPTGVPSTCERYGTGLPGNEPGGHPARSPAIACHPEELRVSDVALVVITLLVMLVGMVGVVVPVLPGLLIVWVAGAGTALLVGTDAAGWSLAGVLTLLFVVATAVSWWLPTRRGLRGDAARSSLLVAVAAGAVGFFVIPVVGLVLGALAGLYLAELRRHGDPPRAWAATRSVLVGYGWGVVVELGAGIVMVLTWLTWTVVRL
ncbi:DUF456 domain-containing protein [Nitriliruptoraceae bacterium ZYF776]|nr:DUF456 domain-containing protein [Profundirhabdus halotolerans]